MKESQRALPPEEVRKKATVFLKENSGSACRPPLVSSLGFEAASRPTGIPPELSSGEQSGSR